jgi:hypothetical protein
MVSGPRILDRGLAVAPDHLLDLENALRNVDGERNAAFAGRIPAVAQQLRSAIFDLHRRDNAGEPAARVPGGALGHLQRGCEAGAAARLVPGEFELEIIVEPPTRRGEAGGDKAAHAAPGEQLDPAVPSG